MKFLDKLLAILSSVKYSTTVLNVKSIEIDPPDLVVYSSKEVILSRFLVCREVEYSINDLSEASSRALLESYVAILSSLPRGVHLYLIKEELDVNKLLRKITNDILNLQADMETTTEESTKLRLSIKLNKLRALYAALLGGKPFTRITLVVVYRVESRDKNSAKSIADYYESLITSSFKNHYGLKLERANRDEIIEILMSNIGLVEKPRVSNIEVEIERIGYMQPLSIDDLPSLDKTIVLGFEKETFHPVEIKLEDFYRHLAIIGPTGRGKTTLLSSIIEQLVSENLVNVVAVDFKGDLKQYLSANLLAVLRPEQAPISIVNKPPGLEEADWRAVVVESLSYASGVSSEVVLRALLAVEKEGLQSFSRYHYVSVLIPFIEFIKTDPDYGFLTKLLGENVLISVEGYGTTFQNTYVALCIGLVRYFFLSKKERLNTVLAIDDAWRILGLKTLVEIIREGRSKGLGVIISTQSPDDIPSEILENVHNIVVFGSRNEDYLQKVRKLGNVKEEVVSILGKLGVGEALYINVLRRETRIIKTYPPLVLQVTGSSKTTQR